MFSKAFQTKWHESFDFELDMVGERAATNYPHPLNRLKRVEKLNRLKT